jgi:hypothetical protein
MHLIDELRKKVLADRRYASAETNVFSFGGIASAFQCFLNASGNEIEGGVAFHRKRLSWVVSEHEDGHVVRRILAPPSFPLIVWPRSSNRTEHISTEDPCAKVVKGPRNEVIVDAGFSALLSDHLSTATRFEHPFVELRTANAERIRSALIWTRTKPVYRHSETANSNLGHNALILSSESVRFWVSWTEFFSDFYFAQRNPTNSREPFGGWLSRYSTHRFTGEPSKLPPRMTRRVFIIRNEVPSVKRFPPETGSLCGVAE